jgi:hypothetical protein
MARSAAHTATENTSERAVEAQDIRIVEDARLQSEPGTAHGGDLVHHDPAVRIQAVPGIGLDQQAEQRSLGRQPLLPRRVSGILRRAGRPL